MGLFDNLFGGSKTKEFTPAEAFAGVLISAVASDGFISDKEAQGMFTIMGRMNLYSNWTGDKFNDMMNQMLGIIKREGPEKLLEHCSTVVPKELKETAFANACDLLLADGGIEEEEKIFLESLQTKLNISGDQALTIVGVLIIKNKG